jgi:hypothetical protein
MIKSMKREPYPPSLGERILALAAGKTRQELYAACPSDRPNHVGMAVQRHIRGRIHNHFQLRRGTSTIPDDESPPELAAVGVIHGPAQTAQLLNARPSFAAVFLKPCNHLIEIGNVDGHLFFEYGSHVGRIVLRVESVGHLHELLPDATEIRADKL